MQRLAVLLGLTLGLSAGALAACHNDDDSDVGLQCETPDDCFPDVDPALLGEVQCLEVPGGYCTHACETDLDCCLDPDGDCSDDFPQVCSPWTNMNDKRCFLSCEADVIGEFEEGAFCQEYASPAFGCRSSGGGSENRKVCTP